MIFYQVNSDYRIFDYLINNGITKYVFIDKESKDYETRMIFKEYNKNINSYIFESDNEKVSIPKEEINKRVPCGRLIVKIPILCLGDWIAVKKDKGVVYTRIDTPKDINFYSNSVNWRVLTDKELEDCRKSWRVNTIMCKTIGDFRNLRTYTDLFTNDIPVKVEIEGKEYEISSVTLTENDITIKVNQ